MVLNLLGRRSKSSLSKGCCYIWELLELSLKQLVREGMVEEEKLRSFNIPYTPLPAEVRMGVEEEASFTITHLHTSEIQWAECGVGGDDDGYSMAKCMRSVAELLLVEHFGDP